jgi:hypothetical protein
MNITEDDLPYNIQYGGLYDNDDNANGDGNDAVQETDEMKENEYNEYNSNHTIDLNNKAHINNDALLDHLHIFKR